MFHYCYTPLHHFSFLANNHGTICLGLKSIPNSDFGSKEHERDFFFIQNVEQDQEEVIILIHKRQHKAIELGSI
jgi:hypothetical protein